MSPPDTATRPPCDPAWSPAQLREFIAGEKAILARLEASGDTRFSTRLQIESCRAAIAKYGARLEEMEAEEHGEHVWFTDAELFGPLEVCRVCGVVKRADGQNGPCRGPQRLRSLTTP